ncbi:MAG: amino acid permease [Planctomycetes bacterium]|nr:amino acid permease [Planctomycetota bacterium]
MSGDLRRSLGTWSGAALLVGTMIGGGIFRVPGSIAGVLQDPRLILLLWVFFGIVSLCGALTLAELATLLPQTGGTYVYLRAAYGDGAAFVFGWLYMLAAIPSGAAALAVLLGELLLGPSSAGIPIAAAALIVLLSAANILGVRLGSAIQIVLTVIKVAALVVLIVFVFASGRGDAARWVAAPEGGGGWRGVMAAAQSVLFTCNGWVYVSLVAGEILEPERRLTRIILGGTGTAIVLYLLANLAYLYILPVPDMKGKLVAVEAMSRRRRRARLRAGRAAGPAPALRPAHDLLRRRRMARPAVRDRRGVRPPPEDGGCPPALPDSPLSVDSADLRGGDDRRPRRDPGERLPERRLRAPGGTRGRGGRISRLLDLAAGFALQYRPERGGLMSAEQTREQLYVEKAVVILREKDADLVRKKAHAARDGGLKIQEITWTTPSVAELIREFTKEKLGTIGAGTILTVDDAKKAVDAGAKFLVSPIYTAEVSAWAKQKDVVYIPGCATPQEIMRAWYDGCRPVKVFPVPDFGGATYIKHVLAPLPFLELLPTGGLGLADVKPYLDAGAKAVGLGAPFTHTAAVLGGDYASLTDEAAKVVELIKGAKAKAAVKV